jgi:hydrogenase small subunit
VDHKGGCMVAGGVCIGCMMPGFPDRFSPFYKKPPGTSVSSSASRTYGVFVRKLRSLTQQYANREIRWGATEEVPSGWGDIKNPGLAKRALHYFYEKLQYRDAEIPGRTKPHESYADDYEVQAVRAGISTPPDHLR